MSKIRCVIVDDEPEAREGVELLLQQDDEVEVVAICANGLQAIEVLQERKVDLLFLDIQMPRVNGFEVLNSLSPAQCPEVIFVTAYDEYTLQAFDVHAIDYLLKPFSNERFFRALEFAKARIKQQQLEEKHQQLNALLDEQIQKAAQSREGSLVSPQSQQSTGRLAVKADGKVYLLTYDQVIWVEAYDYYVKIHTMERYFLLRDSMKNMEKNLPEHQFVRIHKSSIVNVSHVKQIHAQKMSEMEIQLDNGQLLKVSRNYRDRIRSLIKN